MTENKKEFSNDKLSLVLTQSPGCQVKMEVSLSAQATADARKKALQKIRKEVSIPGFRKGKAPEQVILDNFKSDLQREWTNTVIFMSLNDSVDLSKARPLSNESIKKPNISEGPSLEEGTKITFNFESYPEIPDIELEKLELKKNEEEDISEDTVDQTIENIRLSHAEWKTIEDRTVQEGDFVVLNVDDIEQDPPRRVYENQRFSIAKEKMNNWMRDLLIGMSVGSEKEGISEPVQDASKEEKKDFKPTKYKVHLVKIEHPDLPPIDDELAKKVNAPSMDKLKENIRKDLEEQQDRQADTQLKNQAIEKLIEEYNFDLPNSIFQQEKAACIKEKIRQFKEKGISDEEIKSQQQQIDELAEKETHDALRWTFLMQKIAYENKIEVSHQDLVDNVLKNFGGMSNENKILDILLKNNELRAKCESQAKEDKVKTYIIQKATIK